MAQLSQADQRFYSLGEHVEELWSDPALYLDGGLDEAEEETPGLLQRIINTFTWRIEIGMGNEDHIIFRDHARAVREDMARVRAEDGPSEFI